jgi:hypothetical protein
MRALQMKPEDRYSSVRAFRDALLPPQPAPQQVRVAPAPAAAYPSTAPQPAPQPHVPPPPPPAPMPQLRLPPDPTIAQPPTAAPPQPGKARRASGGGGILAIFGLLLAVLLVLGGGAALLFSGVFTDIQAGPNEPPELAPARPLALVVEASVPTGASDDEIRTALRAAYEAEVEQQHPNAVINRSVSISPVGEWERVGTEGGQAVYRASMQGFVALPQGP